MESLFILGQVSHLLMYAFFFGTEGVQSPENENDILNLTESGVVSPIRSAYNRSFTPWGALAK